MLIFKEKFCVDLSLEDASDTNSNYDLEFIREKILAGNNVARAKNKAYRKAHQRVFNVAPCTVRIGSELTDERAIAELEVKLA